MRIKNLVPVVAALLTMTACAASAENKNILRGAIYIPTQAYNAPQMWKEYSSEVTRRDLGFAKSINLNAVRIWLSYEYWQMEPEVMKTKLDDFLSIADSLGILVMPSLFDNCGENELWSKDIRTTFCYRSVPESILMDQTQWNGPRSFVKWMMDNYRNDRRILSIEIYNEPRTKGRGTMPLALDLFKLADGMKGTTPLSLGTCNMDEVEKVIQAGCTSMVHFHLNFPKSEQEIVDKIDQAFALAKKYDIKHVCLGEWQRLRPSGGGWQADLSKEERYTDLSSLAPIVQRYEMSTFFWSLMVKPAYLKPQRLKGTINGLFFEDGSVYSLADARVISGNPDLVLKERKDLPEWMLYPVSERPAGKDSSAEKKKKAEGETPQYE